MLVVDINIASHGGSTGRDSTGSVLSGSSRPAGAPVQVLCASPCGEK